MGDEKAVNQVELHQALDQFYSEKVEPGFFRLLIKFYREVMSQEFRTMIEEGVETKLLPLRDEVHQGFDDLYKKYEGIQQEMTITNHHIRRLDEAVFGKKNPNIH